MFTNWYIGRCTAGRIVRDRAHLSVPFRSSSFPRSWPQERTTLTTRVYQKNGFSTYFASGTGRRAVLPDEHV